MGRGRKGKDAVECQDCGTTVALGLLNNESPFKLSVPKKLCEQSPQEDYLPRVWVNLFWLLWMLSNADR